MLFWAHIANFLTAISFCGFAVLGVIEASLTFNTLLTNAILFGVLGLIGRYIDLSIDDKDLEENND